MAIHGSTLAAVQPLVASGLNLAGGSGGYWNGSGIVSSTAAADTSLMTTLAVIKNDNGSGNPLFSSFDGQTSTITDILVKYTYYGDANLDGKVNGSDYSRIDNGYLMHLTGWFNGDFNYDGVVNGSDYTLIDNAFNRQGASLTSQIAGPTVSISAELAGGSSPVPEPAGLSFIAVGSVALLRRRRFRKNVRQT
jgi:hypothetical protein